VPRVRIGHYVQSVRPYLAGALSFALLTLVGFRLGFDLPTAAFLYLILVTLLSAMAGFLASMLSSLAAGACLSYFFAPPIFSLRIDSPRDVALVAAFLAAAMTVIGLLRTARARSEAAHAAELTLRRNFAYLTEAQRLTRTGSWGIVNGEVLWSEETFRIFQIDAATKPSVELALSRCHPEDVGRVRQTLECDWREGRDLDYEHRLLLPDGSVKHVRVVGHAEKGEHGLELVGAITDITAAEEAREALQVSEQQWRDVFENNPTMYFMVDAAGFVMAVNPFGAEQLGYTVAEIVGQSVAGVFVEADRAAVKKELAMCLEQLGRPLTWQLRKTRKDGSVLWVRETARAVLRAGNPVILIACEDITEQKQAEEKLQQAQASLARVNRLILVGEMTASIAHEVNQPLTGVVAHAGTCLRWLDVEPPQIDEARRALQLVIRDSHRATEVIGRIRELVSRVPPHKNPLNIEEATREVLALTQGELERNSVQLRTHFSPDLSLVPADRVQFQQVILNLIVNAIEAMAGLDRPRELVVAAGADSREVFVEVRDSGPGLDQESLSHLFSSFFTTKAAGMGMGLSISRSIVEAHGGQLRAIPNEPRGAVFRFTLPLGNGACRQASCV
jgi:PAS domain S-box-containing protein